MSSSDMEFTYRRQSHDTIEPSPVECVVASKMVWPAVWQTSCCVHVILAGMASTPMVLANTSRQGHVLTRRDRESGETSTLINGRFAYQATLNTPRGQSWSSSDLRISIDTTQPTAKQHRVGPLITLAFRQSAPTTYTPKAHILSIVLRVPIVWPPLDPAYAASSTSQAVCARHGITLRAS